MRDLAVVLGRVEHHEVDGKLPLEALVETIHRESPDLVVVDSAGDARSLEDLQRLVRAHGARRVILVSTRTLRAEEPVPAPGAERGHDHPAMPDAHIGAGPAWTSGDLTAREREILELLKGGSTTKEIASALHLSERTVDFHRANIKNKLQLRTGAELIAFAARGDGSSLIGRLVTLREGGPVMYVRNVSFGLASCCWFDECQPMFGTFEIGRLVSVDERRRSVPA